MEIEKKFLVKSLPDNIAEYKSAEIEQSYISTDPTIRLRRKDDKYILTVKGKGQLAREEFELELSKSQYAALLKKADAPAVIKTRYFIPLAQPLIAELDIYHGSLDGLYTVEVEFSSVAEAEDFVPPEWFGKDVTYDKRYKNTSLSVNGIPKE